ncbi:MULTISPECIES: MarR family winged helix-turn-helix transcriptional regulator [unclassified Saccharopolyspora]|uniref:MarR family winged helix-turn-helix transcriptional regulator n=1 Tax=unclassified Saccharopolyspora TaxID=2646250 RepID=UPI001CD28AA9|nr:MULTISPECIES: MarR family winged helix-turn-helix transcriptional regulator [unclassified Saccharopolyspora]MCA1190432.1 MarR family winged helix-turn-helix transcriptional regulator [Saccharopolyspora sp. 6T]MCA1195755.1 MarR family winged helix-turn-helix transcriptional regulator [Saccharopolyspora sp. 6V]MCA1229906.1 MarR family winged helix-turn-helix transcriptional regulator [Saccharopolyspora sp. 6M]MCA1281889.1 MarR family winged helix-turn-helix transcriptional regulator [Saccharop
MSSEDELPALEEELRALTRRSRLRTRELARDVHPKLDPTAYPLVVLLAKEGAQRMSAIAAALSLDKSTVSRQVDAVVRIGLAERVADPVDARAKLVVLTEQGGVRVSEQLAEQRRRWREVLGGWDPADIAELARLLHRLGETDLL